MPASRRSCASSAAGSDVVTPMSGSHAAVCSALSQRGSCGWVMSPVYLTREVNGRLLISTESDAAQAAPSVHCGHARPTEKRPPVNTFLWIGVSPLAAALLVIAVLRFGSQGF